MTYSELKNEVQRLKDVIDCGCTAITDAINLGGPDIPRVKAMVRRMRREGPTPDTMTLSEINDACQRCTVDGENGSCALGLNGCKWT